MKLRVFDGHCDTAFELWYRGESLSANSCHIDLQKAAGFSSYAQVFAFCSMSGCYDGAPCGPEEFLTLPLQTLRREVAKNSERIAFASDGASIERVLTEEKIAALLSIEGAEVIGCDPERLFWLRAEGFSMATLTWNADNALAGWHGSDRGLTGQGREFVRTAQSLGILIDVSHLGERSFWDLMEMTEKPIVASHSNSRALRDVTRNLTDEQLRALAQTGGTVGLNLYTDFLGEHADFSTLRAHLERMLTICGETHVALGGDLDGCETLPAGFANVADYAAFYDYLMKCGYSPELLDRIFFTNLLRLF